MEGSTHVIANRIQAAVVLLASRIQAYAATIPITSNKNRQPKSTLQL